MDVEPSDLGFSGVQPRISAAVMTRCARRMPVLLGLALFLAFAANLQAQTPTPTPVTTWRYDLTHAGANTHVTELTPANVNVNTFGKLFALTVDGSVYAQPLYVPNLKMSDGRVHNVLFVATENDSIYAFDADSNGGANANPIWKISLLDAAHGAGPGATSVPWTDTGSPDVAPTIGITGTPTIDLTTNTMYVVAATKENGEYFSRLHAINILTGAEQANSPVTITATVAGTGNGSSGGQLTFSPLWENQRSALDLYNGSVYIAYAAHGDNGPWHGWIFAYNAATLKQTAVVCLSPNGIGAGVWSSGAGMPIDSDVPGGRMFVVTGNGTLSNYPPITPNTDFGESIVDFNLANGGLTATDAFSAFNKVALDDRDMDMGSGGILMVPDQEGAHPHILVQMGKEGRAVVLDRDNLGGYAPGGTSNTNALQDIPGAVGGCWCTPAYWNGNLYAWGQNDVAKAFHLQDGVMEASPFTESSITSAFPSPSFSISANGDQNGISWAVRSDQFNSHGPFVLYAWDANNLSTPIYESDTDPTRDTGGAANRYSTPVVTNGKVYVAANGEVDVYGLFNGEPNTAPPVISPNGGTFSTPQIATLASATATASIFYTLDGSTPTPSSTPYTDPIPISTDTIVNAMASAPGYIQSGVSSATFTFSDQTPSLSFLPAGGTYLTAQQVTISDSDANAKIYYTTDGSEPSASSTLYTGPIAVAVSRTLKAVAIDPAFRNSNIATVAYVIQEGGSAIDFGSGFSSTAGLTLNGNALATDDTRLQLTNGGLEQAGSVFWNAPINIQAFTTTFEFQLSRAQGNGFTFTIQNAGPTALGGDSAGLAYQDIPRSVAVKFNFYNYQGEGDNSTGIYTDGEPPVLPSVDLTPSGIQLSSGDGIQAEIDYDGTTLTLKLLDLVNDNTFTMSKAINIPQIVGGNTAYVGFTGATGGLTASQKILTWTYATNSVPPAFTPPAGAYNAPQNLALSSATADAAIYYTTDGTTPTAASSAYSNPIPVATSETIQAIAISPTVGSSNVVSAAYSIQVPSPTETPGFTLSGGPVSIGSPGASGTSTITVSPTGGFTGSVALSCAITGSPSGAIDIPSCSVSQPPAISGTQPVTATLTVQSTAASTAAEHGPIGPMSVFGGGGAFAALLFFCLPFRRRKWLTLLSLFLFSVMVAAAIGCGSTGTGSMVDPPPSPPSGNSGTTAGTYSVTVTATSGATQASTVLTVTVQ